MSAATGSSSRRIRLEPIQEHLDLPTLDVLVAPGGELVIGRSAQAHLSLPTFQVVSSRHGVLTLAADGESVNVNDTSRNGMYYIQSGHVRHRAIGKEHNNVSLRDGDELLIIRANEVAGGVLSYRIRILPPSAPAAPQPKAVAGTKRAAPDSSDNSASGNSSSNGTSGGGERRVRARLDPSATEVNGSSNSSSSNVSAAAGGVASGMFSPGAQQLPAQPVDDAHDAAAPQRLRNRPDLVVITDRRFEDDFDVIKYLQEGGYARVYKCREKATGKVFAVKVVNKRTYGQEYANVAVRDIKNLHDEIVILHAMKHQHIVRLYQVYDQGENLYIVQVSKRELWGCNERIMMRLLWRRKASVT